MNTRLNSAKICTNRAAGSSGTGTTLICTGTSPSLSVGTGTSLSGTGSIFPLHHGYRYHLRVFAQKTLDFSIEYSIICSHFQFTFHNLSIYLLS